MSRFALYIHVVWTTRYRTPWLTSATEEAIYACILKQVRIAGYEALAIGGISDHVHLLLQCGPQIDLSALMKKVKGLSSALANDLQGTTRDFRWQEGYYAATVTPSHLPKVLDYVRRQKEHHQENTLFAVWEDTEPGG